MKYTWRTWWDQVRDVQLGRTKAVHHRLYGQQSSYSQQPLYICGLYQKPGIISRAKYYQHMYETRSRFDNRYVTKELQQLDLKRQRQGRETVLPLNRRERAKYITVRV